MVDSYGLHFAVQRCLFHFSPLQIGSGSDPQQCDPTSKPDLQTSRAHLKVSLAGVGLVAAVPPEVLAVTGELHSGHAASADLGA